jgi:hypothetical protein
VYLTLGLIFHGFLNCRFSRQDTRNNFEQQLLNVVADLCRFILHEVVHIRGCFVHSEHELATEKKNMKVFVSGTLSTFVTAPVMLIGRIEQKHVFYTHFDDVL